VMWRSASAPSIATARRYFAKGSAGRHIVRRAALLL
jgi:hypothetical protein